MSTPFFSIVIPTRNRPETLEYSIKTILNQTYTDFELIISDNSDNDSTQELIRQFEDDRIKYYRTDKVLSMADNWDNGLNHINGKFTLIIGDDDGMLINGLEVCFDNISKNLPEVLVFDWMGYNWPEQMDSEIMANEATMISDGDPKSLNTSKILKEVLAGRAYYYALPTIYYAFVSTEFIKKIISLKGRFFHSVIPDTYSGIMICHFVKNVVKIKRTLGIRGTSATSNGAVFGFRNETNQYLRDEFNNLNKESPYKWNKHVPHIDYSYAYALESYFQLCEEFDLSLTQKEIAVFYVIMIRRIYYDYAWDKVKVRNDLSIIRSTIKNSNKLVAILRFLLISYCSKLMENNEKRSSVDLDENDTRKYGLNKGKLRINASKFNVDNILDLQLLMDKLLNE